jgi:hypothetical protein
VVISRTRHRFFRYVAGGLLLFLSQSILAAPGFVATSRVSGNELGADVEIRFNCKVSYIQHEPPQRGDTLRIYLEPTSICNGVSPLAVQSRGRYRPVNSDIARLLDFEYDGSSSSIPILTLSFSEAVTYSVEASSVSFGMLIHVSPKNETAVSAPKSTQSVQHRQIIRPQPAAQVFAINLQSFRRMPTIADIPNLNLDPGQRLFYSEVDVEGNTWYRLRIGDFTSTSAAQAALLNFQNSHPGAWIDQIDPVVQTVDLTAATKAALAPAPIAPSEVAPASQSSDTAGDRSAVDQLMDEARVTMVSGDRSRAIQIYTKILQMPDSPRHPEAQEYLALAREKNGQTAHAKAEYQRYLSLYPQTEGTARVSQRLAALLATDQLVSGNSTAMLNTSVNRRRQTNEWRLQTFFSQYYRRDVNQQTDQEEILSQSALYSNVNFDARRRGSRFDFSSRITAGYRSDFLEEELSSGNDSRISYAYADLADAKTGLRGRVGRQSRNSGGILGRFDGLNIGYQATERILVNTVVGKPAYSANDGIDSARTFYGASVEYGPVWDGLELGLFIVHQDIEGITDRRAVGGEFRYFGSNQSVWGLIDYDTEYQELGSAFLQASWRFASRLTINGSFDQRHSPFLSVGNAIIGQPDIAFSQLIEIFGEDEVRQLGLDRSPVSTSFSFGLSYSLSPRFQLNANTNQTSIDETPTSGGVFGMPASEYRYFATSIVASSLIKEGDVTIVGIRHSSSETSEVVSLTIDTRYPISRSWRLNPRLRVDRREREGEADYEWILSPGLRVQYRRSQRFRIDLEVGKQFVERETPILNLDRESYFINLGYQFFF